MLQKPGAIFLRPILSSIHSSCSTVLLLSSHNTRSPPASDFALSSFLVVHSFAHSAPRSTRGTGDYRLLPNDQPGSAIDGVGPPGSNSATGEQATSFRATAAEPAARRPGKRDSGRADRAWTTAHERLGLCGSNAEHSAARGTRNTQRGLATGSRGGSKDGGRKATARTNYVHRWVANGGRSSWLCSGVEEGGILGGYQNSYGIQPGGLRRGVCCPRACLGFGFEKKHNPGTGHDLHRCASGHQTDGIRRTRPWTTIPMPSAGGASAPRKRETTSSRCVQNGRCSRKFCGRRC